MTYKEKYNDMVIKYDLLAKQYNSLKNRYITAVNLTKDYEICLKSLEDRIEEMRRKNGR